MPAKKQTVYPECEFDFAWLITNRLDRGRWAVSLQGSSLDLEAVGAPRAVSPIFSATKRATKPSLRDDDSICFFFHPRAYSALSKLNEGQREGIWFTEGLASLVSIGHSQERIDEFVELWKADLNAYEIWHLKDRLVVGTNTNHWLRPISSGPKGNAQLKIPPPQLHRDTANLVNQIRLNLDQLVLSSGQYAPEILRDLALLTADIQDVIDEICFLENPTVEAPHRVSKEQTEQLRSSPKDRIAELNHRIDLLVQFNSSLSYVSSQGFHGCVPILEQRCLVADHSLLGVGGAWRALSRFSYYVTNALSKLPITKVIQEDYQGRSGVSLDDEPAWKDSRHLDPDFYLSKHPVTSCLPKLAFFSSRLGFGETNYNITAAAQALHAADSPRWSLITLSHEMMHAHVTGLLAAIFCKDSASRKVVENFEELRKEWRNWKNEVEAGNTVSCFLGNLRCWILENRMIAQYYGHSERQHRIAPANGEELLAFWRETYRFMNEVIVHTLDFHYFYNEEPDTYLDAIWESWLTVPGVVDNPREYLLRSMVAVGSTIDGNVLTCRSAARRTLTQCLERLMEKRMNPDFLQVAFDLLKDSKTEEWFEQNFSPQLRLAKVVRRFLRSKELQKLLSANDDENIRVSTIAREGVEDEVQKEIYDLETGAFTGVRVNNPVAFLRDRLWREGQAQARSYSEEFRTAWLFLVLADAKCKIERPEL